MDNNYFINLLSRGLEFAGIYRKPFPEGLELAVEISKIRDHPTARLLERIAQSHNNSDNPEARERRINHGNAIISRVHDDYTQRLLEAYFHRKLDTEFTPRSPSRSA